MKKWIKPLVMCSVVTSFSVLAKTELTVYTAVETELLNDYKVAFEKKHPQIEINWIRDSTGTITAKLLAEKDATKADIAFGIAASSLLILEKEGMLLNYKPNGFDLISEKMRDEELPITWVGMNAWASAFCINKFEMKKRDLPYPKTWEDLKNPIYKGLIATPNPASSGSGYMNVSAWIQMMGSSKAWEYMDSLDENIKMYTHSGTKPCSMAAQGEVAIGISSASFAHSLIKRRAPIDIIIPENGVGWELEASAIMKNTKKVHEAKIFQDWVTSEDVAKIGAEFSGITARESFMTVDGKATYKKMIENDLSWAAQNRTRLISTWRNKYELNQN